MSIFLCLSFHANFLPLLRLSLFRVSLFFISIPFFTLLTLHCSFLLYLQLSLKTRALYSLPSSAHACSNSYLAGSQGEVGRGGCSARRKTGGGEEKESRNWRAGRDGQGYAHDKYGLYNLHPVFFAPKSSTNSFVSLDHASWSPFDHGYEFFRIHIRAWWRRV